MTEATYRPVVGVHNAAKGCTVNAGPGRATARRRRAASARIFRPAIDLLAMPLERDHCRKSFESERNGRHLPKEYQK